VLLKAKPNSDLKSKPYHVKRPILEEAGFVLTQEATQAASWTADEINKRQEELAKLALKAWPLH
jgi:Protein of unknown function (DUF1524)